MNDIQLKNLYPWSRLFNLILSSWKESSERTSEEKKEVIGRRYSILIKNKERKKVERIESEWNAEGDTKPFKIDIQKVLVLGYRRFHPPCQVAPTKEKVSFLSFDPMYWSEVEGKWKFLSSSNAGEINFILKRRKTKTNSRQFEFSSRIITFRLHFRSLPLRYSLPSTACNVLSFIRSLYCSSFLFHWLSRFGVMLVWFWVYLFCKLW